MLGDGDGGERVAAAVTRLLPFADAIWEPVDGEPDAVADGIVAALVRRAAATLAGDRRGDDRGRSTGRPSTRPEQQARTRRSEHFAALHARITEVIGLDPAARW